MLLNSDHVLVMFLLNLSQIVLNPYLFQLHFVHDLLTLIPCADHVRVLRKPPQIVFNTYSCRSVVSLDLLVYWFFLFD